MLVSDEEIVAARAELWQRYRIAAEHGAATAYAAIHTEQIADLSGRKTAVIVCGANTDPRTLEIERPTVRQCSRTLGKSWPHDPR